MEKRVCSECGTLLSDRGVTIDPDTCAVFVDGIEREFTVYEYKIMELLLSHPGKIFSILNICKAIDMPVGHGQGRTVAVHICNIRRKIGNYAIHLRSKKGFGYKYVKST